MPVADLNRPLPSSREHWHAVAVQAAGQLMIDDLRLFGFIKGGPEIDRVRCSEILTLAAAQDVLVGVDQAAEAGLQMWAGWSDPEDTGRAV
jgi:hypothetical protein